MSTPKTTDESSQQTFKIRVPWGLFGHSGSWTPNRGIALSVEEQYRQNVANGYIAPDAMVQIDA